MAPGFDQLSDHDFPPEADEIDFSDLEAKYRDLKEEQGFDNFVVVDGLPIVPEDSRAKLVKFLMRSLTKAGHVKGGEESVFMPIGAEGSTEGFAFVEYESPEQAIAATKKLHDHQFDKRHTLSVNKFTDIDRYGREGRVDDHYAPPEVEAFADKEHLRSWLGDPNARDQFAMFRGDNVGVFWNSRRDDPEPVVDRKHWTQLFVAWSPLGTYLASIHQQGVQLWGGPQFSKVRQLPHPFVSLVAFSPLENYMVTWSNQPISVDPDGKGPLGIDEDGKHIVIWDVETGKPLRSFTAYDLTPPPGVEGAVPPKAKVQWPAFKWSADEKYVARMKPNESLSIYELPSMSMIKDSNKERKAIKIEGIVDFEWAPATPERESIKQDKRPEQLLAYWTPEIGSKPASVGLMSVPSREIVRTRNLFNVTDAKLHWQSESKFMCVKVDRHSKSKKSMATNLEIFRIKEKGVPVEVVDSLKDTVINFAWEPKGDRFVVITAGEAVAGSNVLPKTAVSFFAPEKSANKPGAAGVPGAFKHIRTYDKKNSNGIYWSPKGRFVLVGTISVQQHCDLDFYDLDYEGEKPEADDKLAANLMLMNTEEHYGVTDVEWDPTGRYVVTSASMWTHQMENGYRMWTFSGTPLKESPVEKFKQLLWRPRPPTLLSREEQRQVRRNLREYSREFDELDKEMEEGANLAVVEARRRLYSEWFAWLIAEREEVKMERDELGIPDPEEELQLQKTRSAAQGEETVEEVVEEVIEETEEFV